MLLVGTFKDGEGRDSAEEGGEENRCRLGGVLFLSDERLTLSDLTRGRIGDANSALELDGVGEDLDDSVCSGELDVKGSWYDISAFLVLRCVSARMYGWLFPTTEFER